MRNIVIGANGLVGQAVVDALKINPKHTIIKTGHRRPSDEFIQLDLMDEKQTLATLNDLRPDTIYHCANRKGGVNACEEHPEDAKKFHFNSVVAIGKWCLENNAEFSYISTDYVFDGNQDAYSEHDQVCPLNIYGKVKADAEKWCQENLEKYIIFRTTNIYDYDPKSITPNFFMQAYLKLIKGEEFKSPVNSFGNPTYAPDIGKALVKMVENKKWGLYHYTGPEKLSRYEWLLKAAQFLKLDEKLIKKIESHPVQNVKRPEYVNLKMKHIFRELNINPLSLELALEKIKEKIEREGKL